MSKKENILYLESKINHGLTKMLNLGVCTSKRFIPILTLFLLSGFIACSQSILGTLPNKAPPSLDKYPSLTKFTEAEPGSELTFWGTGNPLRQHIYVDDLAKIIVLLLEKDNSLYERPKDLEIRRYNQHRHHCHQR